jgi:hypothetical protein
LTVGRRLPGVSSEVNWILRRRSDRLAPPAARAGFWRPSRAGGIVRTRAVDRLPRRRALEIRSCHHNTLLVFVRLSTSHWCSRRHSDERRRPLKTSIHRCASLNGDRCHTNAQTFSQRRRANPVDTMVVGPLLGYRRTWQFPALNVPMPPSSRLVQIIPLVVAQRSASCFHQQLYQAACSRRAECCATPGVPAGCRA